MTEDTTASNNPGFESQSRASQQGEQLIFCSRFKEFVIQSICYQCQYWDGLRERCDAGSLNQPIKTTRTLNIPITYSEAVKAAQGATEEDFKREHRLAARKVA